MEKVKVTMLFDVEDGKAEELKKLEHHADYLLNLEEYPEIQSVYGVSVEEVVKSCRKALTIKDFKVGDTAYAVSMKRGRNEKPHIRKEEVTSVGRTYVTTGVNAWSRKYMNWDTEYLMEKVECGESKHLFRTMSDAEDYLEKCDLALWLGCMSVPKAEQYSVEQLRKVRELLQ